MNRVKNMNESIYITVDVIQTAITNDTQVRFQYYQWNVDGESELRHGGEMKRVELLCNNSIANVIYDRFGSTVQDKKTDAEHFCFCVNLAISPQFFGWILGLADKLKSRA